jgi:hypothetical protein
MTVTDALASRIRPVLAPLGATEKRMFGGTCFMIAGNMVAGTMKDELLVRVGKAAHAAALAQPHARVMDFTGRVSQGFVVVAAAGIATEQAFRERLQPALDFVRTLPPKDDPQAPSLKRKSR